MNDYSARLGAVFSELDPVTGVLGPQVAKVVVAARNDMARACDAVVAKGVVERVVEPKLLGGVLQTDVRARVAEDDMAVAEPFEVGVVLINHSEGE